MKARLSLWVGLPLQGVCPPQQVQTYAARLVAVGLLGIGAGGTCSVDATTVVVDAYALWSGAP